MSTAMEMIRVAEAGFVHPFTSVEGLSKTVDWYKKMIRDKSIDTFWVKSVVTKVNTRVVIVTQNEIFIFSSCNRLSITSGGYSM